MNFSVRLCCSGCTTSLNVKTVYLRGRIELFKKRLLSANSNTDMRCESRNHPQMIWVALFSLPLCRYGSDRKEGPGPQKRREVSISWPSLGAETAWTYLFAHIYSGICIRNLHSREKISSANPWSETFFIADNIFIFKKKKNFGRCYMFLGFLQVMMGWVVHVM